MSLTSSSPSLTTPPPPLTKRPDLPRSSPAPQEAHHSARNEGSYLYHAMTASLLSSGSPASIPNSLSASSNFRAPISNSSFNAPNSSYPFVPMRSFSPSNYPGPPPTITASPTSLRSSPTMRTSPVEGPLRFGSNENKWQALSDSQRLPLQLQQHHSDLNVKVRRKTIDGASISSGAAKARVSAHHGAAKTSYPTNHGAALDFSGVGATYPPLAPLPSASALNASLNASLQATAAPTLNASSLLAAAAPFKAATEGKDSAAQAVAAAAESKTAAKKRAPRKPKATGLPTSKEGIASYEDTLVNGYAEVLYRCTLCSASTPAMFKTRRNFVMHFCSVHAKDSPALKPVTDAIRASGTNKPITIDLENNNNNNNLNNYNNGSPSEPPSKKRKRESGPQPPAGLLAIAEGLKKNGTDVGWPYSALLSAAMLDSNPLVKENLLKPPQDSMSTSSTSSMHYDQPLGMDRPLKIELDDSQPKSSPTPPAPFRVESTNRRKKGMMIPTKLSTTSPTEHVDNAEITSMKDGEESFDMPPSPQPLTIISEDDLKKKSHKTAFMEALLQKTMETTDTAENNNDDSFNNNNLTENITITNNNNNTSINRPSKLPKSQSSAKAYANALNALTGPGLSRSQLISAFSSPDAFRNLLPPPTAPDGSFIKMEPAFASDPTSAFPMGDSLAGLPLAPGLAPSFTNDPYMDALKTLFLLPSLSAEERLKIEKPYECDQCGRRFTRSDKVSRHKLIHSGEKPFECDLCHKRFHRSDKLTVHKKIHTGERPHECDVCGKRFTRHYHLTKHRSLHTGNRPHACNVCPKKFFDRYSQLRHMKTHPENAALFAACNTPQEVIEALNAVTGFGGGVDGRLEGRPDAALFSPNNNPSWTKEMEALFRAAKSDSPTKGSDISGGDAGAGSQKDLEEDFEEDSFDEDDTDDEMEDSNDGSSVAQKLSSNHKKISSLTQDSGLLGLSTTPPFLPPPPHHGFAPIKKELYENNNIHPEDNRSLLTFASADGRSLNHRHSLS